MTKTLRPAVFTLAVIMFMPDSVAQQNEKNCLLQCRDKRIACDKQKSMRIPEHCSNRRKECDSYCEKKYKKTPTDAR
jgi:hypothetical protein